MGPAVLPTSPAFHSRLARSLTTARGSGRTIGKPTKSSLSRPRKGPTLMRLFAGIVCSALLASCARGMNLFSPLPPSVLPDAGAYALLYSFKSGEDAGYPYDSLTPLNGTLYGTTYGGGGGYEWGTVFNVSTRGEEHVLYRFKAGTKDGAH